MTHANTPAVKKCAALARLEITAEEEQRLGADFDRILAAFRGLTELDLGEVAPVLETPDARGVLREDERRESLSTEQLLASAPEARDGFFAVPKTVEGDS